MTDEQEYRTVGALLDSLLGKGVYDVALVEDVLTQYGFTYNRATDKLHFHAGAERLGVASASRVQRSMDREDPLGSGLVQGIPENTQLVDALMLSRAIHKLLMPGQPLPGDEVFDRGMAYQANVDSILAYEATDPHPREN